MEPFEGKRPFQVIGAVLHRGERPRIPDEASASPDIVPLMQQCWMQDPAQRPEGFSLLAKALEIAVTRVGDPRSPGTAAEDVPGATEACVDRFLHYHSDQKYIVVSETQKCYAVLQIRSLKIA